jgi:hypothetical protein
MYLGYNHKEELTKLTSKLTLHFQKEIKLHFFGEVEVNGKYLQGFCVSGLNQELPRAIALDMIKDFKCIHINKENTSEVLFVVCESKEVLNLWYKMRWEGLVATSVCRKFNFFDSKTDEKEVMAYRLQKEQELADKLCVA